MTSADTESSTNITVTSKRLLKLMRPERLGIAVVIVVGAIGTGILVTGPKILGHATDIIVRGVSSDEGIDFTALHRTLIIALGAYLVGAVTVWLQGYVLTTVVQRSMHRLRAAVEDKLNSLPLPYVDRQPRGELLSRVTNDIDNIAQSLQHTLSQLVSSTLMLVGVLVMMLTISWLLALVVIVTIPLVLFVTKSITRRSQPRFREQWGRTGTLNGHVEESFTGHSIVRAFNRQDHAEAQFELENEQLYRASFAAQFTAGTMQPTMNFLGNLNFVGVAVLGGLRVSAGAMTIGDIQAFMQYSRAYSMPLTSVASMANIVQSGVASAERVFQLLDAEEQAPLGYLAHATDSRPAGHVEFDHVSFSYEPNTPLIQDLSLVAEPGRTVAIVGPTGAGKTTLVNLIMRFYDVDLGAIRLDGRDITEMPREELRGQMGMVLQDTWLFNGTIRENIAYGNPDATEDEILAAAKATYVDRFVHALPHGYDTVVDDEGTTLSAGEKQLVTIARAFLSDPTVLILDEATSSVDTRTELLIQRAMAALRADRTVFVIAHRLSTIRDADVILVMDAGKLVEQGNHVELLTRGGAYAALYQSQFAGPTAEVA